MTDTNRLEIIVRYNRARAAREADSIIKGLDPIGISTPSTVDHVHVDEMSEYRNGVGGSTLGHAYDPSEKGKY
jgi:hypothetical protein